MLRSSHDACGCSTQTTSTINLKRSTHPHEGQADRPNTPSDSVNLGSNPGPPVSETASDVRHTLARVGRTDEANLIREVCAAADTIVPLLWNLDTTTDGDVVIDG